MKNRVLFVIVNTIFWIGLAALLLTDPLRLPIDRLVEFNKPVTDGGCANKPALHRVTHERRAFAPVMRIVVQVVDALVEQAALLEIADDALLGIL